MLAKPQTYMNLSGTSLAPLMEKHCAPPDRPDGGLRRTGSAVGCRCGSSRRARPAGHNGMNSVIASLGTSDLCGCAWEFIRAIRCGAARNICWRRSGARRKRNWSDFVGYAADAVRSIIAEGVEKAMTKFNRRAQGSNKRKHENLRRAVHSEAGCAGRRSRRSSSNRCKTTVDGRRRHGGQSGKMGQAPAWHTGWTSTAKAPTCCSNSPPGPETVKEFERRLRVSDLVIKFLTVRIDETLKRLEKRKKERDKRARQARRASRAAAVGARSRCPVRPRAPAHAGTRRRPCPASRRRRKEIHGGIQRKTRQRRTAAHRRRQSRRHAEESSISGARKSAVSASRRSTTSITRTSSCCTPSWRSAARSSRAAFPASARRTSGG